MNNEILKNLFGKYEDDSIELPEIEYTDDIGECGPLQLLLQSIMGDDVYNVKLPYDKFMKEDISDSNLEISYQDRNILNSTENLILFQDFFELYDNMDLEVFITKSVDNNGVYDIPGHFEKITKKIEELLDRKGDVFSLSVYDIVPPELSASDIEEVSNINNISDDSGTSEAYLKSRVEELIKPLVAFPHNYNEYQETIVE